MNKAMLRVLAVTAFVLLVATPSAMADNYKVQLTNGTEVSTLYLPKEASWDREMLIFLTDTGNWMAVSKEEVEKIVSVIQQRGFGRVIDDKTVEIGFTANFGATDEELKAIEEGRTDLDRYLDVLQGMNQTQPQQDFSVEQFVSPGAAGQGGIPATYGASGVPSGGVQSVDP